MLFDALEKTHIKNNRNKEERNHSKNYKPRNKNWKKKHIQRITYKE